MWILIALSCSWPTVMVYDCQKPTRNVLGYYRTYDQCHSLANTMQVNADLERRSNKWPTRFDCLEVTK